MSEPSLNDQPLIAHLIELRDRLIRILVVILIFFLGFIAFANDLYAYLANPLQSLLPEGASMIATQVASPFLAPFKLALYLSVYCGAPMILYQLWGFIAPGLYDNEKKIAGPLLISSIVLFYAGMAFAYFAVFPLVFGFFTTVGPTGVTVMTDIDAYLSFVLKLFLAFWSGLRNPDSYYAAYKGWDRVARLVEGQAAIRFHRLFCGWYVGYSARRYQSNSTGRAHVASF